MDKISLHIGVGDSFTYKKEHWMIIDVRSGEYVCRNKITGAVVKFEKNIIDSVIK